MRFDARPDNQGGARAGSRDRGKKETQACCRFCYLPQYTVFWDPVTNRLRRRLLAGGGVLHSLGGSREGEHLRPTRPEPRSLSDGAGDHSRRKMSYVSALLFFLQWIACVRITRSSAGTSPVPRKRQTGWTSGWSEQKEAEDVFREIRVAVLGAHGAGKSSLVAVLADEGTLDDGE